MLHALCLKMQVPMDTLARWQEVAKAEQRFAQCNDSCEEARGGRLKTPPALPPLVAPAVDPWGSAAMRPMPDRVL